MKTFKINLCLIFLLSVCAFGCRQETTPIDDNTQDGGEIQASGSIEIDLSDLLAPGVIPEAKQVMIAFDHFFKSAKTYRAYALNELLAPYVKELQADPAEAVVTFYCTNGYKPTKKLDELLNGKGFLAFEDADLAGSGQAWADSISAKFEPFYLVWENTSYDDQSMPWPYGLFKIKIDKTNTVYKDIYPFDNADAIAGFQNFRDYCIKCHSINKIGGNVGPDFNHPKNITDYWDIENMWAYAKNPQSFRYNARMHPMDDLSRNEFDAIIQYLRFIRNTQPLAEVTD